MASFFTPKRSGAPDRQTSRGSTNSRRSSRNSNSDEISDAPQHTLDGGEEMKRTDSGDDEAFEKDHSSRSTSSWKKLRKSAVRFQKRGSVLHRNTDRGDHLSRLTMKRMLREASLKQLTPKIGDATARDFQLSDVPEVTLPSSKEYDESFMQELRDEVEREMKKEMESEKIMELEGIIKKYKPYLKGNESPLEIRLKNVTYTVPVDEGNSKIQTVYNASLLYTVSKFLKRRVWQCEPRPKKVMVNKKILANISLVFKPGRQYLVVRRFQATDGDWVRLLVGWMDGRTDRRIVIVAKRCLFFDVVTLYALA